MTTTERQGRSFPHKIGRAIVDTKDRVVLSLRQLQKERREKKLLQEVGVAFVHNECIAQTISMLGGTSENAHITNYEVMGSGSHADIIRVSAQIDGNAKQFVVYLRRKSEAELHSVPMAEQFNTMHRLYQARNEYVTPEGKEKFSVAEPYASGSMQMNKKEYGMMTMEHIGGYAQIGLFVDTQGNGSLALQEEGERYAPVEESGDFEKRVADIALTHALTHRLIGGIPTDIRINTGSLLGQSRDDGGLNICVADVPGGIWRLQSDEAWKTAMTSSSQPVWTNGNPHEIQPFAQCDLDGVLAQADSYIVALRSQMVEPIA